MKFYDFQINKTENLAIFRMVFTIYFFFTFAPFLNFVRFLSIPEELYNNSFFIVNYLLSFGSVLLFQVFNFY